MTDSKRKRLLKKHRQRKRIIYGIRVITSIFILTIIIFFAWILFVKVKKKIDSQYIPEANKSMVCAADDANVIEETEHQMLDKQADEITQKLIDFSEENNLSLNAYSEELIELLRKNLETEEFVLNYPLKKGTYSRENLTEALDTEEIPLLMQWDARWGYYTYGDNVMGLTGCGPTCLSMVASWLLCDSEFTPLYIAEFSIDNGYCVSGHGTSWELMSQGAEQLGLYAQEVPLHENTVVEYLQQGKPIICIMGEGDFTDSGHYIVFAGIEDGKIKVNDPNSRERSEKLWEFNDIKGQIRNMWVYEV